VTVGDFNGDGKSDLATANFNSNNVSVLLNADPTATVTITDVPQPPISLSINDVTLTEGNSGTTNAVFTVSLSSAANTAGLLMQSLLSPFLMQLIRRLP
jgi:hypothetical protein